MLKVRKDSVKGYKDMAIPFSLISKKENAKNLMIMLPGAGYTVQAPLLHYSTGLFINHAFDVLQVNYQYSHTFYDAFSKEQLSEAVQYDVRAVLDHVLNETSYKNYWIVGKSFGTIAMSSELSRAAFKNAKAVWLTPLLQRQHVFNALLACRNKGLCFIGDNDPYYVKEKYDKITENQNITSSLIPHVNHSLQYDNDAVGSIDVLKRVISDIEQFIKSS